MQRTWHPSSWQPFVFGIIGLVVGLSVLIFEPERRLTSPWSTMINEFAIALIIFALLTFTFEGLARHHLQRTTEEAFDRLGIGFLGNEVFPVFNRIMQSRTYTRRDVVLDVAFSEIPQSSDFVKLSFLLKYVVTKESTDDSKFKIQVVDDTFQHGINCTLAKPTFFLNDEAVTPQKDSHETAWAETWYADVDLRPREPASVAVRYEKLAHRQDRYHAFMTYLTYDARIVLKPLEDLDVTATLYSPVEGALIKGFSDHLQSEWRTRDPSLPGQAFAIKWRPKVTPIA